MKFLIFGALFYAQALLTFGQQSNSICSLPKVVSPCRALIPRFYFDSTSDTCQEFFYGGCSGNGNNFATKEDCEKACANVSNATELRVQKKVQFLVCPTAVESNATCAQLCKKDTDCTDGKLCCQVSKPCRYECARGRPKDYNVACSQPVKTGPCRGSFPRFAYNGSRCVQFIFGGCDENENNFMTQQECDNTCAKSVTNEKSIKCPEVTPPAGCHLVKTSEKDALGCPVLNVQCVNDPCSSNPCTGICERCLNSSSVKCVAPQCPSYRCEKDPNCVTGSETPVPPPVFVPPSCATVLCSPGTSCTEANGLVACKPNPVETAFSNASPREASLCQLPPQVGPCRAAINRWFFNFYSNRCERFTYGGCGGNENNFDTRESCEASCSPFFNTVKPGRCPDVKAPQKPELCGSGQCRSDLDCGSGQEKCCSNGCAMVCMLPQTNETGKIERTAAIKRPKLETLRLCRQPPVTGNCRAALVHWHFDFTKGMCRQFTYGGCGGNSNNFETKEKCEETCAGVSACPMYSPPFPIPGCGIVSSSSIDGCPIIHHNCTGGECAHQKCSGKCEFCVNVQKQCLSAPCQQYRCESSDSCLYEQCVKAGCPTNSTCGFYNGVIRCLYEPVDVRCRQPSDSGICLAYFQKYFYNSLTGKCEQFVYGGCLGNENRFDSLVECEKTCLSDTAN